MTSQLGDSNHTCITEDDTTEDDSDLEPYPMPHESDDDMDARTPDKKKLGKPVYAIV